MLLHKKHLLLRILLGLSSNLIAMNAFAQKQDQKVYSKFKLINAEATKVGTVHTAMKGESLFATSVEAIEMVKVQSSTEYKGAGPLGLFSKTYRVQEGSKFYKVFSSQFENIYCEVGRYEIFDNCLIDSDGDLDFDLGVNKLLKEDGYNNLNGFSPAKILHETKLENEVPYEKADKKMPLEYIVVYKRGSKKPKFTTSLFDKEKRTGSWYLRAPSYPKKAKIPYVVEIGDLKLKIISLVDKEVTVEILQGFNENSEILVPY